MSNQLRNPVFVLPELLDFQELRSEKKSFLYHLLPFICSFFVMLFVSIIDNINMVNITALSQKAICLLCCPTMSSAYPQCISPFSRRLLFAIWVTYFSYVQNEHALPPLSIFQRQFLCFLGKNSVLQ